MSLPIIDFHNHFAGPSFALTTLEGVPQAQRPFWEGVNRLLADPDVLLPEAVVLDVGLIEQRGWAAVELNPATSSGIYGCDPDRVLSMLEAACVSPTA